MRFILKLKRPNDKESALCVEFKINKQRFKFYPGKTIQKDNWSVKRQEVLKGEPNFEMINEYLDKWKMVLGRAIHDFQMKGQVLSKELIQAELDRIFKPEKIITGRDPKINDFITFIDAYILPRKKKKREVQKLEQTKKLVLIGFELMSQKNLQRWDALTIKEKSQTILKADKKLPFTEINLKFLEKFRDFLYIHPFITQSGDGKRIERHYKINYIDKLIKGVKQIINAAIEEGYVTPFRWTSLKAEDRQVDSVYTDIEEIQLLNDVRLENVTDRFVRDKYILNCFLGLRYSDLNKLEPHLFKSKIIGDQELYGLQWEGAKNRSEGRVRFAPISDFHSGKI
jgi:hypothetical protein